MHVELLVPGLEPDEAKARAADGLPLPALEAMLARGDWTSGPGDSLEHWLVQRFRLDTPHEPPYAALSLLGEGIDPARDAWLRADPVHLEVRRDRVVLLEAALLALQRDDAASLVAGLNDHFAADGIGFIAPVPDRWYLRTPSLPLMRTTPPAAAGGPHLETLLPAGPDGTFWRRIMNEAQMLLHAHPCNAARLARGLPPVNSIWPWGAGSLPAAPARPDHAALWSNDALATGIAKLLGQAAHRLPDPGSAPLPQLAAAGQEAHLVILDGLRAAQLRGAGAWREALVELEEHWFAPCWRGLARGTPARLTLHMVGAAASRQIRLGRRAALRFWRRSRPYCSYAS